MTSSVTTVLQGLGVLAGSGVAGGAISAWARRAQPHAPGLHALRDDSARDPLVRPLRSGCGSFEIGLWLDEAGRLQVGARRWDRDPGNAVGPLVLGRLAARAERYGGHLYPGQRQPVMLMIDILETEPARAARAYAVLDTQLRAYASVLTHVSGGVVTLGAVTVALSGACVPRHLLAAQPDRYAFCDGSFGDVGAWAAPATLVPLVSEHWAWRFGWDGVEDMLVEERQFLREIVESAHADGRRVRFYGIPESPTRIREAYWTELLAAGVDVISTRAPNRFASFMRRPAAKAPAVGALAVRPPSVTATPALAARPSACDPALREAGFA
jgi:hypothetical protein